MSERRTPLEYGLAAREDRVTRWLRWAYQRFHRCDVDYRVEGRRPHVRGATITGTRVRWTCPKCGQLWESFAPDHGSPYWIPVRPAVRKAGGHG